MFARDLASTAVRPSEIVAVDVNEYLLDEARSLAVAMHDASPLRFEYGNAESIPFEDGSFDIGYSVTVFEECDADKAIAELKRVLKPGGRVGVIVRSADLPWYWGVDVAGKLELAVADLRKVATLTTDPSARAGILSLIEDWESQ